MAQTYRIQLLRIIEEPDTHLKTMCVRCMNNILPNDLRIIESDSGWDAALIKTREELELKNPNLPESEIITRLRLSDATVIPNEPIKDPLEDSWEQFQAIHRDWAMFYLTKVERQLTVFRDREWNKHDKVEGAYETEGNEA